MTQTDSFYQPPPPTTNRLAVHEEPQPLAVFAVVLLPSLEVQVKARGTVNETTICAALGAAQHLLLKQVGQRQGPGVALAPPGLRL